MPTGHQQVLADMAPQSYADLRRWGTDSAEGRGLLLLAGLSNSWGVRARSKSGETVWCLCEGADPAVPGLPVLADAVGA